MKKTICILYVFSLLFLLYGCPEKKSDQDWPIKPGPYAEQTIVNQGVFNGIAKNPMARPV